MVIESRQESLRRRRGGKLGAMPEAPTAQASRISAASSLRAKGQQLDRAGATSTVSTGYLTSHVQGSCRMGSDPERSVCDANQQLWDVANLYLADGSVIPRTLTYNPSLTIMALAERLASHLDSRLGREAEAAM